MKCVNCKSKTKVIDSRYSKLNNNSKIRRRECLKCNFKFNTYESVENNFKVYDKEIKLLKENILYYKNDIELLKEKIKDLSEYNKILVDKLRAKSKRCIR